MSSGKVESKGGLSVVFSDSVDFLTLMGDHLDSRVDGIGGSELLFFDLIDVILDWDVSVGDFNEIGSDDAVRLDVESIIAVSDLSRCIVG